MRKLRKRIGLVHELRKLRCSEKFSHLGHERRYVHQASRRYGRFVLHVHVLADYSRHLDKPDAYLVFKKFADRTHAAVAKMVYVVNFVSLIFLSPSLNSAMPLYIINKIFYGRNDVFRGKSAFVFGRVLKIEFFQFFKVVKNGPSFLIILYRPTMVRS